MKGLYLNTPPKPKQAKAVELQEVEQQKLEDDRSLEEENEVKVGNRSSKMGGCNGVEALEGAAGCAAWCAWCLGVGPAGGAMELKQHRHGP